MREGSVLARRVGSRSFRLFALGALLLATTLLAFSGFAVPDHPSRTAAADEWPTLGHDAQRTGAGGGVTPGPYSVRWGWNTTQDSGTLRFGGDVQPVIAGGRVFVGALDGTFVALNAVTGAEYWRVKSDNAILGTASVAGNLVYVGSQDGRLHAYDVAAGTERWSYRTKGGVWAAPLIAEDAVVIGSRDGTVYALDAALGTLRWSFATGAPITMSAAYSAREHLAFVGAENSEAFAFDLTSGTVRWRQQLAGQGFRGGWPVVVDDAGIVIFRTMPAYFFGTLWGGSEGQLLSGLQGKSAAEEQATVRQFLQDHPDHQTFYALHAETGEKAFVAPVLYVAGNNRPPAPPVLNDDGSLLVEYSSRQNFRIRAGDAWNPQWSADFGVMNPRTGAITPILLGGSDHGRINGTWPFRLITDEGGFITRAGSRLIQTDFEAAGGVELGTGTTFHLGIEYRNNALSGYPSGGVVVYPTPPLYSRFPPDDAHFYLGAGVANSAAVSAGGLLFWRVSGGAVVAIGGAA